MTAIATATVLVALAGCSGGDDGPELSTPDETIPPPAGGSGSPGTDNAAGDSATTLVAAARAESIGVWSAPTDATPPAQTVEASEEPSGQIVMVVRQELGQTWLEAYLPAGPPGSTGWIRQSDVTLTRHRFRIEVSLPDHTLTVHAGEVAALETPVAVGPDAPAPSDGLFIKDLVEAPDPAGAYGRYAYGLAGSSNRIEDFNAGAGVVGIHGTADEGSLGGAAPSGSLAIGAEALDRMVGSIGLPLGTPVQIVP
jgi:hypothetical protein